MGGFLAEYDGCFADGAVLLSEEIFEMLVCFCEGEYSFSEDPSEGGGVMEE